MSSAPENEVGRRAIQPGGTNSEQQTLMTGEQPTACDHSALRAYLDAIFADTRGNAVMALGTDPHLTDSGRYKHGRWTETVFAWPAEADRLHRSILQAAYLGDVYLCPYLMLGDKRHQSSAVELKLVHADIDDGRLDPDRVRAIPGAFAVCSGSPGNGHVYVPLSCAVTLAQHRALCVGLRDYFGAIDSKITPSDLLRPPSTLNYKPTLSGRDPAAVTW